MCWITQNTDAEIMEAMAVSDYSWEGHGLEKGDVTTATQGVPVKNNTKLFLTKMCQGLHPINLTTIRREPQEAQDGGASQLATGLSQWTTAWSDEHRIHY